MKKLTVGITLDFSKCKTPEDVDKVWGKAKSKVKPIKKFFKKIYTKTGGEGGI